MESKLTSIDLEKERRKFVVDLWDQKFQTLNIVPNTLETRVGKR